MPRAPVRIAIAVLLSAALAGCGDSNDTTADGTPSGTAPLPQPGQLSGAVTDMPTRPGPGEVPIGGEPPAPPELPSDEALALAALEANPETGLADANGEPTATDAGNVLRQYYAAIGARDYARAQALWADAGRASGQTSEQFAATFAQVATVETQIGDAGSIEAAAGSRYIEIPVVVRSTLRDGSLRVQAGRVVLRRAMIEGATAEQRAWRIASADLRDAAN